MQKINITYLSAFTLLIFTACNTKSNTGDTTVAHAYTNKLAGESSPYLLQYSHNPVNWYP